MRRRRRPPIPGILSIYSFAIIWFLLSFSIHLFSIIGLLLTCAAAGFGAFLVFKIAKAITEKIVSSIQSEKEKREKRESEVKVEKEAESSKKSYGPEVDAILTEGQRALSEMGRLYMSIDDIKIRSKINEIMRLTDKIVQDAIDDPSDIPSIKKFLNYYLPTTIKLLHTYDRMRSQGIEGENVSKTITSIEEMLDTTIEAYRKHLDSLFENQALDVETDIEVMNTLLQREGLSGKKDFNLENQTAQSGI